jgi:hypothetical protein
VRRISPGFIMDKEISDFIQKIVQKTVEKTIEYLEEHPNIAALLFTDMAKKNPEFQNSLRKTKFSKPNNIWAIIYPLVRK